MITNRRMGLKIWRIQRIKIPGITESKRKPLDYKARQRVGIGICVPLALKSAGFAVLFGAFLFGPHRTRACLAPAGENILPTEINFQDKKREVW